MIGDQFRPLGARIQPRTGISRRLFLGAGLATPMAMFLVDAWAQEAAAPSSIGDLRFVEDVDGVTVIDARNAVWHLPRIAFGPETFFLLRTLRAGCEKGYELEISGVTFGLRKGRRHWIVFQRLAKDWRIRMRSNLWSAEGEITSDDVLFSALATPAPIEKADGSIEEPPCVLPAPRWFVFNRPADDISSGLAGILEGHVRASGALELAFDADAVWRIRRRASGRLEVAPFGFPLSEIALAWCDPITESAKVCANTLAAGIYPLGAEGGVSRSSEPVFCTNGVIPRGAARVRCVGESSFAVALEHEGKEDAPALSYTFIRQDWTRPGLGSSEIRGSWQLTTRLGDRTTLGAIDVPNGVLRTWRKPEVGSSAAVVKFTGAAPAKSHAWHASRIGRLKTSGWNDGDSSVADGGQGIQIEAHYANIAVGGGEPATAKSVSISLLLHESELALGGSECSRFLFASAAIHAIWQPKSADSAALLDDQSYLWLGASKALNSKPIARLDLTRARVEAARGRDLLQVAFLFADLFLEIRDSGLRIVPAASTCRVVRRETPATDSMTKPEAEIIDARPTLVVEFPPQHIFEESLFKPAGTDLPEVKLPEQLTEFTVRLSEFTAEAAKKYSSGPVGFRTTPAAVLRALEELTNSGDRRVVRTHYAELKKAQEQGNGYTPFTSLSKRFATRFKEVFGDDKRTVDFVDQSVYIGPYGMDADVGALARETMREVQRELIEDHFTATLKTAADLAAKLNNPDLPADEEQTTLGGLFRQARLWLREHFGDSSRETNDPELALQRENAISAVLPDYAFFRDFYRDNMTALLMEGAPEDEKKKIQPKDTTPGQIEYFSEHNRTWASDDLRDQMKARQEHFVALYIDQLDGGDDIPRIVRARLANPSRLAFHLNCGANEFLPFALDALTDWSRHELAVMPRARAVTVFDESGRPLRDASGASNAQGKEKNTEPRGAVEDIAMLGMLGIRSGKFVTAQERLSDVEASLRKPPGPLETAIEIPARLILSPSQRALWKTPRPLTVPLSAKDARQKKRSRSPQVEGPVLLWGAEIVTDNPHPAVRAVHSPDLRPGFVRRGLERAASGWVNDKRTREKKQTLYTTALSAPPRGPRAPWTIGIEEGDPNSSSLEDVIKALGATYNSDPKQDAKLRACEAAVSLSAASAQDHPLIDYLRWRKVAREQYKAHGLFRSSLDAYDRHEIVLLSSAFGLPVRGKRELNGQLLPAQTSSQVEPPGALRPIDLEAGTALYRPRPLKVQELRLTALGGTFRHDTDFVPPTAARHISYGALYDSFSIERWQHWVVLGRDVFAEVVYKGFLFPIGHRASLVKQTERVFLRATDDKNGKRSVRAYLRQRMFIRVGQPDKVFPALGQPNLGRQFPAGLVRLLTTVTPDLVDPAQDMKEVPLVGQRPVPAPGGRLFASKPGLVFWPRTARASGAEVRFEALLDSAFVRVPLIFVDNTAAHDTEVIKSLIEYYRTAIPSPDTSIKSLNEVRASDHLRTVDFAGQALRYCDELKPGSATHRTLYWTLSASAGITSRPEQGKIHPESNASTPTLVWEGDNTQYDDPSLEGADQPPFYPVLETARIRLDQVERMTAQTAIVGLARLDGYYVANGFPTPKDPEAEAQARLTRAHDPLNPLDIYLDIINSVPFNMGAAGDRSGGLFRPESTVVALSRLRGPIGGEHKFNDGPALTTVVGNYTSAAAADATVAAAPDSAPDPRKAYHSYFSSSSALDTKLLGIVKVKDLVKHFLNIKPADQGLPQLREVVSYGVASSSATAETIRANVIVPLNKAVEELWSRWRSLDTEVRGQSGRLNTPLTIGDIFPEVDQAIREFRVVLGDAAAAEGTDVYTSLAEVYESGTRLGDALERASAHPLERTFMAVAGKLMGLLGDLQSAPGRLAEDTVGFITAMAGPQTDRFATELGHILLTDRRSFSRFLWLPGSVEVDKIDALIGTIEPELKQALLQCTSDAAATDCAERFAKRFLEIVSNATEYKPLAQSLTPLFRVTQNLAGAVRSRDPRALAAVAWELLSLLGPVPSGRILTDAVLNDLFKALLEAIEKLQKIVANVAAENTMVSKFVAKSDSVTVPPDWRRPQDPQILFFSTGPTLEGALYDFAEVARTASTLTIRSDLRSAFVDAANAAFPAAQKVRLASDELANVATRLNSQVTADDLVRISRGRVAELFVRLGDLMDALEAAIDALLPEKLPALGSLKKSLNEEIAKQVAIALSLAIQAQQQALAVAMLWIDQWEALENALVGTTPKAVKTEVAASIEKLGAASRAAKRDVENWSQLIEQRSVLRPQLASGSTSVPRVPALTTLTAEAGERIDTWFTAALSAGSLLARQASLIAGRITGSVAQAYQVILKTRQDVYGVLTEKVPELRRGLVVIPQQRAIYKDAGFTAPADPLTPQNDQLYWDQVSLSKVASKASDSFLDDAMRMEYIAEFLRSWKDGSATPLRIINQTRNLNLAEARARLLSIIDFSTLREQIDEYVKKLIPHSSKLIYAFGVDLGPDAAAASDGIFVPQHGCKLRITSETTIDFFERTAQFRSVGDIGPFNIHLVGTKFDALTLMFDGARVESTGGPARCDIRYRDFKIGKDLNFLSQLQAFFTPKQGSGFYLVPLRSGVGIEAGYGLNLGTISLGTISFFNISLNAAARIPFDDRPATFVASLSRRDAPFTISAAPYGGSGFFALEASAKEIVGFEASFEFGGAAAFQYGPLDGNGRLMTGVYIRRGKASAVAVTFYAGGTASIWIFSFGASLYVTAESSPGSTKIVGNATFTFSFSIGFADYDFRVNVRREIEWQGGGSTSQSAAISHDNGGSLAVTSAAHRSRARVASNDRPEFRADSWCQGEHWGRHREYLDLDLDIDVQEFA